MLFEPVRGFYAIVLAGRLTGIHGGVFTLTLPTSEFDCGGKTIEAFTLEDKSNSSYEILFIDKATQKSMGAYSVRIEKFKEKGVSYDIQAFFDFSIADFKRVHG
jgi:hypothetical protein